MVERLAAQLTSGSHAHCTSTGVCWPDTRHRYRSALFNACSVSGLAPSPRHSAALGSLASATPAVDHLE